MFNKRAGGFYFIFFMLFIILLLFIMLFIFIILFFSPRDEAEWVYTPIKLDPRVYCTTSKTFLEKRVSMELISMTLL